MFLNARIRCQGCRGRIDEGLWQPWWYCPSTQRHLEHVLFQNPRTGNWHMSKDLRNTYYHPVLLIVILLRNSSERWCQGKNEPYPCKPFEWRVWTYSLVKAHMFPGSLQLPTSLRHSLHSLACSYVWSNTYFQHSDLKFISMFLCSVTFRFTAFTFMISNSFIFMIFIQHK